MHSEHKLEVLRAVEASELTVLEVLDQLEIPRSTFYRWRYQFRKRGLAGLRDYPPGSRRGWNQILPQETGSWRRPYCFQSGPHGR